MKKILALLFIPLSAFSMDSWFTPASTGARALANDNKAVIDHRSVHMPHSLQDAQLYHSKNKGFVVIQHAKKHVIDPMLMDKTSRNMDQQGLKNFLVRGYFAVNQTNDGSFTLRALPREEGGGVLGAVIGAFVGKMAVSVVGHGTLLIIAGLTGPAAPATYLALESAFGAQIELASVKGAIAGGMIGGVATGPV